MKAWVCLFGTRSSSRLLDEGVVGEEGRKSVPSRGALMPCGAFTGSLASCMRRGLVGARTVSAWVGPWLSPEGGSAGPHRWSTVGPGSGEKGPAGPSRPSPVCRAPCRALSAQAGLTPGSREVRLSATAPDSILEVACTLINWLTFWKMLFATKCRWQWRLIQVVTGSLILMNCRLKVLTVFKHQKASLDGNTPQLFLQGLKGICCRTKVPFFPLFIEGFLFVLFLCVSGCFLACPCEACGILVPLHGKCGVLTTGPPGKFLCFFFKENVTF